MLRPESRVAGFALLSRFSLAAEAQMSAEAVEEKVKTFVFQKKCGAPPSRSPQRHWLRRSTASLRGSEAEQRCSASVLRA